MMKTWRETLVDIAEDAFYLLDHSKYMDVFTPEAEAEAIKETADSLVKALPAGVAPEDDAPADFGTVNIGYYERLAADAAEIFEKNLLAKQDALKAAADEVES